MDAMLSSFSFSQTFDECVANNEPECTEPIGHDFFRGFFKIIPYFCGQASYCTLVFGK